QSDDIDIYTGLTAPGGSGDGWEQTGNTLYAPIVKKSHYGRSSKLVIVNLGSASTTANITFYPSGSTSSPSIPVNGRVEVASNNWGAWLCSAVISAGQPLAVLVVEQNDSAPYNPTAHSAYSFGAQKAFIPVLKRNYYGQTTAITVQNL